MRCDNEKITHRHRILPGHEGGEYVEGNVVKVGPENRVKVL
jgi:hypothetical protein